MISRSSDRRFGNPVTWGTAEGLAATRAPLDPGRPGLARLVAIGVIAVTTGLLVTACGRKDSKGTADGQETQRVALAVAMREGKVPPPPAIQLRGGEPATPEVLDAYTARLAQLIGQRRDVPETLDELVKKWPMPALPTPPPGKQIVYDGRNHIIKLYPP